MTIPLSLGPLAVEDFVIRRSGVFWLCEDGHQCRANEVIGYCNISLEKLTRKRLAALPMADEQELQVAFATPHAGRLKIEAGNSPGGYLNTHGLHTWSPEDILGYLDPVPVAEIDPDPLWPIAPAPARRPSDERAGGRRLRAPARMA